MLQGTAVPGSSDGGARAFRPTADPAFLWRGPQYEVALTLMQAAVVGDGGLLVLTGPPGTGKTVLTQSLVAELRDSPVLVGRVLCPSFEDIDFVRMVALAFGLPARFETREAFLVAFERFVADAHANGQRVLLVIDEAQSLSPAALAGIKAMLPSGSGGRGEGPAATVLLAGHAELVDKLREAGLDPDVGCRLHPLSRDQVEAYVAHRLGVVGITGNRFTPESIRQVWISSGGIPRSINALCYHALSRHSMESRALVTSATVLNCAEEVANSLAPSDPRANAKATAPAARQRRVGLKAAVAAAAMIAAIALSVVALRALPAPETRAVPMRQAPPAPASQAPTSHVVPPSSNEERRTADGPGGGAVVPGPEPTAGNPASLPRLALTPEPRPAEAAKPIEVPRKPAEVVKPEPAPAKSPEHRSTAARSPEPKPSAPKPVTAQVASPQPGEKPQLVRSGEEFDPSRIIDWLLKDTPESKED